MARESRGSSEDVPDSVSRPIPPAFQDHSRRRLCHTGQPENDSIIPRPVEVIAASRLVFFRSGNRLGGEGRGIIGTTIG
jgi:hypothetical protein